MRTLLMFILALGMFAGCAKRYELGMVEPRPFKIETLKSKKAMLFISNKSLPDRFENFDAGSDFRGLHAVVKNFFQKKFQTTFASFVISQDDMGATDTDILFYPALSMSPTDDGPLAKNLVMNFGLTATDRSGKKIANRNMEKKLNYASTTKAEIEFALGEIMDEVSEDILNDLSKVK